MDFYEHQRRYEKMTALVTDERTTLRIAICGCFKSGKTSLLNLLFGLNLPVKTVTATGTLTKIHYGTGFRAEFARGISFFVSEKQATDLIAVKEKKSSGVVRGNAVTVWVGCQNKLLSGGAVEFWDTPGLNDDETLDKITAVAVEQCDVVIYVMDARRLFSLADKNFLAVRLKRMVGNNIIVVINEMDLLDKEGILEVLDDSLEALDGFGNENCGYCPVFTSAKETDSRIDALKNRLKKICLDVNRRRACLLTARHAKIKSFAEEWQILLNQDLQENDDEFKRVSVQLAHEEQNTLRDLVRKYEADVLPLEREIHLLMCKFGDIAIWRQTLEQVKHEKNWEKNYVALSQKFMRATMEQIFSDIRTTTEKYLSSDDYPACFPLQIINTEEIWDFMDWGTNFEADNTSGMLGGAVAGATVGSIIPGIGTAVGAIAGFVAGVVCDVSKDEEALKNFQENCINATIQSYQGFPAHIAEELAVRFINNLFDKTEQVLTERKNRVLENFRNRKTSRQNWFTQQKNALNQYIEWARTQTI